MKQDNIHLISQEYVFKNDMVNTIIITCDKICLIHNSLEIEIHIPNEKIERFETIIINGIAFKKGVLE